MLVAKPSDSSSKTFRVWMLPSWLGLDAPCVVLTWIWAVSCSSGTILPRLPAVALFFVVWFIYLADRLIDVAKCHDWAHATGRLRFGHDYRPLFWSCLALCVVVIAASLAIGIATDVLRRAALVALGVGLYYLAFVIPIGSSRKLPGKEFGVGLFFAFGAYAFLGVTLHTLPMLLGIAMVVAVNCLVIAARDGQCDRANDAGGAACWWLTIDRDLVWFGAALTILALAGFLTLRETAFYLSLTASFALLTVLHRSAQRWSGDAVRALADFALLTPLPVFGLQIWFFAH